MADREMVIKGLECIAQKREQAANPCKGCGYSDRPNYAICVKDIASDALALLKEQEAVEPTYEDFLGNRVARCGNCNGYIVRYKYCPGCGKAVKWE